MQIKIIKLNNFFHSKKTIKIILRQLYLFIIFYKNLIIKKKKLLNIL